MFGLFEMWQNTTSAIGQIKYLVYSLEKAIMNLTEDQEKMVWLTDFQCWTLGSTPLKVTRETVNVLQDCYPERLGLAILYNPPRIFESFWKVTTTDFILFTLKPAFLLFPAIRTGAPQHQYESDCYESLP
jgi:hypothetical protein